MVYTPYQQEEQEDMDIVDEQYQLFRETIENLDLNYEEGLISDEEYAEARANIVAELNERLAEIYETDEIEYSGNMSTIAEFASAVETRWAAAVLELGQVAGYEDIEEYITDLAEEMGYDPEYLAATITGEIEPDDDDAVAIAEVMDLPDEYAVDLLASAYEARGEDLYEELENMEEEDEDEYEEDAEEVDEDVEEVAYAVADLQDRVAEFETADAIKSVLADIEKEVTIGLQERWLTPILAKHILGEFEYEEDRIAAFSSLADSNKVDLPTQLFGVHFALNLLKEAGTEQPFAQFGAMTNETFEVPVSDAEFQQAKRNALHRLQGLR